jgi:hypothetical protein
MMKKLLVIGIIFLFIGVAVAPSINSSVVKPSDDLVEVTSQACGIQGFGNTTVKLTKERYQNLEQYLVDFRARLNQTTTRGEAVPLFKEAVVELNRYGLLPKGMSVEKVQRLVLNGHQNPQYLRVLGERKSLFYGRSTYENSHCLIAGYTTNTASNGPIACIVSNFLINHNIIEIGIIGFLSNINPIQISSVIGLCGVSHGPGYGYYYHPAIGWIYTNGDHGIGNWNGSFYGAITNDYYDIIRLFDMIGFFPAIIGFTGIKIGVPLMGPYFYLGKATEVLISNQVPHFT